MHHGQSGRIKLVVGPWGSRQHRESNELSIVFCDLEKVKLEAGDIEKKFFSDNAAAYSSFWKFEENFFLKKTVASILVGCVPTCACVCVCALGCVRVCLEVRVFEKERDEWC